MDEASPRALLVRALEAEEALLAEVEEPDLRRATPCAGWDLAALIAHLVGQQRGFALALTEGDAPATAYAPVAEAGWLDAWRSSRGDLLSAASAAAADPSRRIHLIEVTPGRPLDVARVLGIQLLDTVIHTWDVAASLGRTYRPDADLVEAVARGAAGVPAGEARTRPGAAFRPQRESGDDDPWHTALRQLGRDPEWAS